MAYLKKRAVVYLKKKYYDLVVKDYTEVIEMAPKVLKVFYRRCKAYEAVEKLDLDYLEKVDSTSIKSKTIEAKKGSDKWVGSEAKKYRLCLVRSKMLLTSV